MKTWVKHLSIFLITFLVAVLAVLDFTAYAASNMEAIVSQQTTTIQHGQTVEDVVILGHDVTVKGTVSEILVVVDGDIHLASGSRSGIVVDVGGHIHQAPGAKVNAVFHMSLNTPFWNGALFGLAFAALVWAGMLGIGISFVILSALINLGLRKQADILVRGVEDSVRRVGLLGLLMSVVILGVSALCAMTFVGLPITGFMLILYVVGGLIGASGVSLWLGNLVLRHSPNRRPVWMVSMLGAGVMMALSWIPLIGVLLFCMLWLMGIGTVTTWVWGMWQQYKVRRKKEHI